MHTETAHNHDTYEALRGHDGRTEEIFVALRAHGTEIDIPTQLLLVRAENTLLRAGIVPEERKDTPFLHIDVHKRNVASKEQVTTEELRKRIDALLQAFDSKATGPNPLFHTIIRRVGAVKKMENAGNPESQNGNAGDALESGTLVPHGLLGRVRMLTARLLHF